MPDSLKNNVDRNDEDNKGISVKFLNCIVQCFVVSSFLAVSYGTMVNDQIIVADAPAELILRRVFAVLSIYLKYILAAFVYFYQSFERIPFA